MKNHRADSPAENRGVFENVADIVRKHNKKSSTVVDIVPVWLVIANSDLTEGRGHYIVKHVCSYKTTARRLAKSAGVQGTDADVKKSYIFQDMDAELPYGHLVLGPLTGPYNSREQLRDKDVQKFPGVVPPTEEDFEAQRRKEENEQMKQMLDRIDDSDEDIDEDLLNKMKELIAQRDD